MNQVNPLSGQQWPNVSKRNGEGEQSSCAPGPHARHIGVGINVEPEQCHQGHALSVDFVPV